MILLFSGLFVGCLAGFVIALACYENEFNEKERKLREEFERLLEGTDDDLR